jgi:hypothetical protein
MQALSDTTRPGIVCPDWCVYDSHEDSDRPGGVSGERYDVEFARGEQAGCFVHGSAESNVGGVSVRLSASLTLDGLVVDGDQAVVVDGERLTTGQARVLAQELLALADKVDLG